MTSRELCDKWLARQEEWQRFSIQADASKLISEFLADLEDFQNSTAEKALTLAEAAAQSGYSPDHLGLLIRQGKIVNIGRLGAPRIRAGDLPRKSRQAVATANSKGYDVIADAQALMSRDRENANGASYPAQK